jgi:hypothetical protein
MHEKMRKTLTTVSYTVPQLVLVYLNYLTTRYLNFCMLVEMYYFSHQSYSINNR